MLKYYKKITNLFKKYKKVEKKMIIIYNKRKKIRSLKWLIKKQL